MATTTTTRKRKAKRRVSPVGWYTTSQGYRPLQIRDHQHPIKIFERMRPGGNFARLTEFISANLGANDDPKVALEAYARYLDSLGVLLADTSGLALGEVTVNDGKFIFDLARKAGYAEMSYHGGRLHIELVRVGNANGYKLNRYLRRLENLLGGG